MRQLQDLVLVPGHAAFKAHLHAVPDDLESDDVWELESFQAGEGPFYLEHIRSGVVLAAHNPAALLVFSGGRTRQGAGKWTEARTYHCIAKARRFWIPDSMSGLRQDVEARTTTEEFARDSFENLLFGICRFQQVVGRYPRLVTVAGWAFKSARFDLHRRALRFPASRFRFVGVNEPVNLQCAVEGECKALRLFIDDPYGCGEKLAQKRQSRNPFGDRPSYAECPGLEEFFRFMEDPGSKGRIYAGPLPWEESSGLTGGCPGEAQSVGRQTGGSCNRTDRLR